MRSLRFLSRKLAGFKSEERGSIAVEAVIILPMLFWTYLALYATFHSYRTYAVNQKAAYTIGDMISRETNPIDAAYLDGTRSLLMYLTNGRSDDTSVRVTIVRYDADSETYLREWSQAKGYATSATDEEVAGWDARLPVMSDNERIIVVETYLQYDPPFDTGLAQREVRNFVFTKPRYAPQVLWASEV